MADVIFNGTDRRKPFGMAEVSLTIGDVDEEQERPPIFSWQTGALIVALMLIAWGVWWSLQPPTADGLYNRIMGRVGDESIDSVRSAEDDIRSFLNQFSDDPRAKKIRGYQREIDLYQQDNKISGAENPTPVERAYSDALGYASSEPEKSAAKLQAVIDLYAAQSDASLPAGNCIELARRHLKLLRQEIATFAAEQLPLIQSRLDRADSLKSDEPQRAAAMYRAVIELYSAKPWAATAVERAKAALKAGEKNDKLESNEEAKK